MAFDLNNTYQGNLFGRDRVGYTTPDAEATEVLRPWLPVPYPAPYLPAVRQDQGHPVLANIVLSSQQLVGLDASGGYVPAGLFCGSQSNSAATSVTNRVLATTGIATFTVTNTFKVGDEVTIAGYTSTDAPIFNGSWSVLTATTSLFTAQIAVNPTTAVTTGAGSGSPTARLKSAGYCVLKYGANDVGFAYNAITGNTVAAAGETAVLAAPANGANGDVVTFPDGTTYSVTTTDITNALACTLFPMGVVKPIGLTIRNVFQYIGGTTVNSTTGGMQYSLNGVIPIAFKVHNYMHEMGAAIQTEMVIRLPWIGAEPDTLSELATLDGVAGYVQSNYGRSFVHFTGPVPPAATSGTGYLANGNLVVGSRQLGDAGNYAPFNTAIHDITDVCGRILGIQNLYPIKDYAQRVRTLWDPSRLVGPIKDPNPSSIMMGGSQTGGIDYQLNLGTDGLFRLAYNQGTQLRPEYSTYVLVKVSC